MGNFRLKTRMSSRHHLFSKSMIWLEKIGSRDPGVTARTFTSGSRVAGFCSQIIDLNKNRPRDDKDCAEKKVSHA